LHAINRQSVSGSRTKSRLHRPKSQEFCPCSRFRWEGPQALAAGKHTVVFAFVYDGPGLGKGGTGVLTVDGKKVASNKVPHTIPFLTVGDETFDIGADTRTPVDDKDYQVPFAFNGHIDKLTFKLGPMQLTDEDQTKMRKAAAVGKD
jgi:hypothetical protein